ncbi:hypothetical protein [Nocardia sp. NPDC127526]|uniref:hypothetical protein n=1 Tax=Nocardia sp. NPDC127526 TaxID=3345393 RepID=UPI00362FF552
MPETELPDAEPDPRARWRRLPAEPAVWIEEKAVEPGAFAHGVPHVDETEDFVRKYGLGF